MEQLIKKLFILLLVPFLATCGTETIPQWNLVYKNDENGKSLLGSKKQLIEASRQGYEVRIGFGGRSTTDTTISIEHVVDAHFLTITNGKEVFAQILPINGQIPGLESDTISMDFREGIAWTISVGTNGYSDRITINKLTNMVEGHQTRLTQVSWFVKGFNHDDHLTAKPLY